MTLFVLRRQLFPSMGLVSAVVPYLDPRNEVDEEISVESSHRQDGIDEKSKLRQRNSWCFFPPT